MAAATVSCFSTTPAFCIRYRLHISLALFVFGLRMWAHAYAGGPVPFYDQWVFAFNNLAIAPQPSALSFLGYSHNEHRIITTQFIEKFGLWWNGYYDVRVTLVASASIRALNAAFAFSLLSGASRASRFWAWVSCFVVFAIPYSGYNALNGMQVSFYFVDLAMLFSVWLVLNWPPHQSLKYLVLFVGANLFGLLSFSQAVLIPAATLVVHIGSRRRRPGFFFGWGFSVLCALLLVVFSPRGPAYPSPRLGSVINILAWPVPNFWLGIFLLTFYVGLLICALLDRAKDVDQTVVTLWGVVVYCGGAAILLALRRSSDFNMRHYESLAPIGIAMIWIAMNSQQKVMRYFGALFMCIICLSWIQPVGSVIAYYHANHAHKDEVVELTKNKLAEGKIEDFGDMINRRLLVHDYSFFLDPVLQYSPGYFVAHNIKLFPWSMLKVSPEILPFRPPTYLSLLLLAITQLYGIFIVIAVALLYPWGKGTMSKGSKEVI